MSASDVQKIIMEIGQVLLALTALLAVIFFEVNHIPVPDIVNFVLGAMLLALGVKIGVPLQSISSQAAVPPQSERTNG